MDRAIISGSVEYKQQGSHCRLRPRFGEKSGLRHYGDYFSRISGVPRIGCSEEPSTRFIRPTALRRLFFRAFPVYPESAAVANLPSGLFVSLGNVVQMRKYFAPCADPPLDARMERAVISGSVEYKQQGSPSRESASKTGKLGNWETVGRFRGGSGVSTSSDVETPGAGFPRGAEPFPGKALNPPGCTDGKSGHFWLRRV